VAGCAGGKIYQAKKLPAEFLVPPKENVQTLDLSRLVNFSVSSELIDRGDVLEVTIETGYGTDRPVTSPVRVGDDGAAMIPLVGKVPLAGLELEGAEQAIAAVAIERGLYRNPSVTVVMKRQRTNKITVVGAVDKPGVYDLPRASSALLAAIVEAGGLTKHAGTEVEIRRPARGAARDPDAAGPALGRTDAPGQQVGYQRRAEPPGRPASSFHVNLAEAAKQGSGGHYLEDGDVVMVEVRDPEPVRVIGLVNKPGEFELPASQDLRVLDALALAGGQNTPWADKIHLIRRPPGREAPVVIEVSISEAKRQGKGNLRLGAGDVVSIEQTPTTVFMSTLSNFAHFTLGAALPIP
jgi:polysaccharide export outer membrane protein